MHRLPISRTARAAGAAGLALGTLVLGAGPALADVGPHGGPDAIGTPTTGPTPTHDSELSIVAGEAVEGDPGDPGILVVVVEATAAPQIDVAFRLHSDALPGEAEPNADFVPFDEIVTLPMGETSVHVEVELVADHDIELDEVFPVRAEHDNSHTFAPDGDHAVMRITDDDATPTQTQTQTPDTPSSPGTAMPAQPGHRVAGPAGAPFSYDRPSGPSISDAGRVPPPTTTTTPTSTATTSDSEVDAHLAATVEEASNPGDRAALAGGALLVAAGLIVSGAAWRTRQRR